MSHDISPSSRILVQGILLARAQARRLLSQAQLLEIIGYTEEAAETRRQLEAVDAARELSESAFYSSLGGA